MLLQETVVEEQEMAVELIVVEEVKEVMDQVEMVVVVKKMVALMLLQETVVEEQEMAVELIVVDIH